MAQTQLQPSERNWADLMDALLRENFTAKARSYARQHKLDQDPAQKLAARKTASLKDSSESNTDSPAAD